VKDVSEIAGSAEHVSYMLCGDFNSNPRSGVVQLMLNGKAPSNHADWYSSGKSEYIEGGLEMTHNLQFMSACGTPEYTNYVTGFSGCLDYIFASPNHFEVKNVIAHPPHKKIIEHSAIPSISCPSDHIAQVSDFAWKEIEEPA
jgi:2',5'-phosphodiesterase